MIRNILWFLNSMYRYEPSTSGSTGDRTEQSEQNEV